MSTKQQVRAACYCRISSDPNDRREGVERQRSDTSALCEIRGWTPVDYYIDNNRSASNGKARPRWEALLSDIESGKIDAIAAWDQDRNWRVMSELEELRRFFTKIGREIKLATTGQGEVDLYSPAGVLTAQIKTAVSEHEIAMMRVRQRRAGESRAQSGKPKWRKAFGYIEFTGDKRDDDGFRAIDHTTGPLVAQAYRALLAGHTLGDIAAIFNDAKAYGLNGQPWTPSTVSLFLRSPRNAALRSYGGEIVGTGTWAALVPEATWRAAQTKLSAPGRAPGRKSVRKHPLTGMMRCGREGCDGYLGGTWVMQKYGGPKAHSIAYTCKACHRVVIRAEHVEDVLYGVVGERLSRADAVDLLKAEVHDQLEAEVLRAELATLYAELDKLAAERAEGLMDGRQLKVASDIVNGKIAKRQRAQQDQERLAVFDGLPLGTPEVVTALKELSADRFRAVLNVLLTVTIAPVGKGHRADGEKFDPERVHIEWKGIKK